MCAVWPYAAVTFLGEETWGSYYYSDQEKDRGKILKLKIFANSQLTLAPFRVLSHRDGIVDFDDFPPTASLM